MNRRDLLGGVLIAAFVTGCAPGPSRDQLRVRDGLLMVNLDQKAFLAEWGPPDRTASATSEEQLGARWGGGLFGGGPVGGRFFKGKRPLDVWVYERRGVELVFEDGRLVTWRTDKSVQELRSTPRP